MNAFTPLPGAAAASAIALYAQPSANFDAKLRETVVTLLKAAATGPVTQASSLGAEDMVITHLINAHALPIEIFVLDTGALHAETLALLEQLKAQQATRPHAPLTVYQPSNEQVVQFVQREGADAMYRSIELRKACCGIRKMAPLARALAGKKAWVTGLRREQSGARADVPLVDRAELESKGLLKYNPLADWSWGDIWHYIASRQVAYNPLHDRFYPSIGCAPCTRAVTLGEDFRAGRWWWEDEQAKECGLHVRDDAAPRPHPNPLPPAGEGASNLGAMSTAGLRGAPSTLLSPLPLAGEGQGEGAPSPAGGGLGWGPDRAPRQAAPHPRPLPKGARESESRAQGAEA